MKVNEESERVSDTGGRTSGTKSREREGESGGMVAKYKQ